MGFEADEEILQDFLVEAGEILEQLSEQLIELEKSPDDRDLLNSIFRGFHTVKGGAGFLQLNTLVDCCHAAENVFDTLRNGHRTIDAELMDAVLKALDSVNDMFAQVSSGAAPEAADPELVALLHQYAAPQVPGEVIGVTLHDEPAGKTADVEGESGVTPSAGDDITDDEFEALLDSLADKGKAAKGKAVEPDEPASAGGNEDDISDNEFEALLDQLHGKGTFNPDGTAVGDDPAVSKPIPPPATDAEKPSKEDPSSENSNEITDDEFEALLDQLHGKGQFKKGAGEQEAAEQASESDLTGPEPVSAPNPVSKTVPQSNKPELVAKPAAKESAAPMPERAAVNAQDTTVRVDTKRLDDIMNMVGELVLVRNRMVRLGIELDDETLQKAVGNLNVVTADLQASVMKTRMQPIKKVFGRFPRVVRDLARTLKKDIELDLIGEETDLDKNLVDALADPLVHLVRNSVDHGIEIPDVRVAAGKPRTGKIILSAEQEGDHILLTIRDDGGGMDPDKLRGIAVKRGVMDQEAADRLSDTECFNLIFAPGFSTKAEISDVSGRGVGMDVVKTKISQLNGTIEIDSKMGVGTVISIKVPLTLAIMPTLMVMLGNQAFALPLVNVNEIFHLDLTRTNVVDGREVVMVRGKPIPLHYLKRWLTKDKQEQGEQTGHVVVVSVGTQKVGFVVDQLVGQEEVVIKPLGQMLQGTDGMSGATITGDGRIALILDVPSLLKAYAQV